jgi:RNA polymerase sigma-70 factor (ECF subfamily)
MTELRGKGTHLLRMAGKEARSGFPESTLGARTAEKWQSLRLVSPSPAASLVDTSAATLGSLVARIAGHEQQALTELYDLAVGRLHALARRITREEADAEEVICDVFLQVWDTAAEFDARRGNVMAWLTMLTRSRALDRVRRRRTREAAHAGHALDPSGPERQIAPDPMDLVDAKSLAHDALEQLTPEQRQVIGLAYFRGLTQEEVAVTAGLPLGTVKSHMRRGIETLREYFAG